MAKLLTTGNEIIVQAALDSGAEMMFGYPITPTTEIMSAWTKISEKDDQDKIKFLQAEDEMAAGFMLIGGVLAGKVCFTATAGPGNVLLQDPMSMAEAMRLPTVAFIMQRGGPSTGTVIYSQQEVTLTCRGGNGEGMRIVYAPSTLQELYGLSHQAFQAAWRYHFPTFVLGDGYLAKMQGQVETLENMPKIKPLPYLGAGKSVEMIKKFQPAGGFCVQESYVNLRNCYNLEEELFSVNQEIKNAFDQIAPQVTAFEANNCDGAETVIFAFGIVAAAARQALVKADHPKIGLFRPITLNPFPREASRKIAQKAKKILVLESSLGQLTSLVKEYLYGLNVPIETIGKPALGFTPEEITSLF